MRRGWVVVAGLGLLVSLMFVACETSPGGGYSAQELNAGVTHEDVDDPDGLVSQADVFHPWEDELPAEIGERLAADGTVVLEGGPRGHDTTIVYRTGPLCGLLPEVNIEPADDRIVVVSRGRDDVQAGVDCNDLEFTEAIGLVWTQNHDGQDVEAEHHRP